MKKLLTLTFILLLISSCRYKDLCYDHHHDEEYNMELELELKIDLDVELDVSEEAHTKIDTPTYMMVRFYDPLDNRLVETEFVGPKGGPLRVSPGTYDMVVYTFDTEWTQIRGENNINTLEAFTSDITATKSSFISHFVRKGAKDVAIDPIIYTPDHLLVTRKQVEIPPFTAEKQVITIEALASTIVETYGFEVTNITGIEFISSAEAYVTNQARSTFFARGEKSQQAATIFFPLEVSREEGMIKTTFNTFGKLPGESQSFLHIMLTDTEGNVYTVSTDITDKFDSADHIIVIDEPIDIPAPEAGGGIAPTVEEWETINQDVPIG